MSDFTQPHRQAVQQLTGPGAPFEVIEATLEGRTCRAYKNAPTTLLQVLNQGRQFSEQPFIDSPTEQYTYGQFYAASDALAAHLSEQLGTVAGQRVAIAMRNSPEWLIAFTAIISMGGVAVPLNSWGRTEELRQGLQDSAAKLVICDQQRFEHIGPEQLGLPYILLSEQPSSSSELGHSWDEALANGSSKAVPSVEVGPDDAAILLYSSGTSGRPKGAKFSHFSCGQAIFNIELIGAATYMTNTETLNAYLTKQLPSKTLLAVPLFHISGLFSQFIANLKHGRQLYIMYKWDAIEAARLVKERGVTVLMGAPVMMTELLESGLLSPEDTAKVANISAGGSATPTKLYKLYEQYCPESMSGAGWGLTETCGTGAAFTGHFMRARPGSSGFVSPIVELKFRNEQGGWITDGSAGEIWLRSSTCIGNYVSGDSDHSDFVDGWFNSGDIGYVSDEGLLYLCDRAKDMIIRGGENIYPIEVENCLLSMPGCEEVGVVGLACEHYGEKVAAVVKSHDPGLDANAVKAHCAEHLAGFKVPQEVVITKTELPRNATRKLLKGALRSAFFGE